MEKSSSKPWATSQFSNILLDLATEGSLNNATNFPRWAKEKLMIFGSQ